MTGMVESQLEDNVLVVRTQGEYSVDDFLNVFKSAFETHEMPETVSVLVDARLSTVERSKNDRLRIVETLTTWFDRVNRFAYVTESEDFFIAAEQAAFHAASLGRELKPFRDVKHAKVWLDYPNALRSAFG